MRLLPAYIARLLDRRGHITPLLTDAARHAAYLRLLRAKALDIVHDCDDGLAVLAAVQAADRPAAMTTATPPMLSWLETDGPAETTGVKR